MRLELGTFHVREVEFSSRSQLTAGKLMIDKGELEGLLSKDPALARVAAHLAMPGEKTRIVHVLDVIEPRYKVDGPGCVFPGFLGPPRTVGEGLTHRLTGVAVVEATRLPHLGRGVLIAREQIIDMAGPGANYSPFSRTINVVLTFEPAQGVPVEEYEAAVRLAGLKTASYLAALSRELKPDESRIFELSKLDGTLPAVAYVYQVECTGPVYTCYLYGQDMPGLPATLLHPNELLDGAMVSGKASMAVETYVHCNNPVVNRLYSLHGRKLNFVGIVLTVGGESKNSGFAKERGAYYVAKLAKLLGAQGAILTQEGGGNSIMDQMLICQACEEAGIKTVVLTYEMGGVEGDDIPLIFTVPQADAIVSVGNREAKIELPVMEKVIGGETAGETAIFRSVEARGGFQIHLNHLKAAVSQVGFSRLRGLDY